MKTFWSRFKVHIIYLVLIAVVIVSLRPPAFLVTQIKAFKINSQSSAINEGTPASEETKVLPTKAPAEIGKEDSEIQARIEPFEIQTISPIEDPYIAPFYHSPISSILKVRDPFFYDGEGVVVWKREGEFVDHPVRLAQTTILFVHAYELSKEAAYLERAKKHADRLASIAEKQKNGYYFPYTYDHSLHGVEMMKSPWYSGMAQGQALSAFARVYKATNDKKYLDYANQTFQSLIPNTENHGVSIIDQHGYYWIEEYPSKEPTHVLNGYIFAIYGLYDYFQVSQDPLSKKYLQASLTTISAYIDQYQRPGEASYYGLKYDHVSKRYHAIHTRQLFALYRMTDEKSFRVKSEEFQKDCGCTLPRWE